MPLTKSYVINLLWLLQLLAAATAEAVSYIHSVRFEGNEVTRETFLRQHMFLAEGDMFDDFCLQESLQSLMDTGLFKSVEYYIESDSTEDVDAASSQIDLVIVIREKHYLFLLPRFRVKDNERHVGIQLRWDNIFGMNQSMRFLVEDRGSTLGIDERNEQFEYDYPNILGSPYSLSLNVQNINEVDDTVPGMEVDRQDKVYGFGVQRWLNDNHKNYGWFANAGWSLQYRINDAVDPALADDNVDALVLGLGFGFSKVHDYGFNRGGKEYGYSLAFAHKSLNSDSDFAVHRLYYRSYYRFPSAPMDNLNVQTILGHATGDILGAKAFSPSATDLRGYDSGVYSGNALLQINMEYQTPAENHPRLRYVVFMDMANTYEDVADVIHFGLHTGIGVGLRWKIPSFVKVDLRLDAGYGLAVDSYKVTAGTRYSF